MTFQSCHLQSLVRKEENTQIEQELELYEDFERSVRQEQTRQLAKRFDNQKMRRHSLRRKNRKPQSSDDTQVHPENKLHDANHPVAVRDTIEQDDSSCQVSYGILSEISVEDGNANSQTLPNQNESDERELRTQHAGKRGHVGETYSRHKKLQRLDFSNPKAPSAIAPVHGTMHTLKFLMQRLPMTILERTNGVHFSPSRMSLCKGSKT
ncbi:hypothetical protein F5Y17DRAFT_201982 [Xylariaceae sp. FL0594]|nr:hypothetical protein F5Y17DRAFT_201982 [Xylariaceae sp. FL0594]